VVGKHDPSVDVERRAGADLPNRIPQRVDLCHQQIRPAVEQVRSEEECPTWNPIATIIRHDGSMPGFGERPKALPRGSIPRAEGFSALRVLESKNFNYLVLILSRLARGRFVQEKLRQPARPSPAALARQSRRELLVVICRGLRSAKHSIQFRIVDSPNQKRSNLPVARFEAVGGGARPGRRSRAVIRSASRRLIGIHQTLLGVARGEAIYGIARRVDPS
jgi:hypothetical protein